MVSLLAGITVGSAIGGALMYHAGYRNGFSAGVVDALTFFYPSN